MTGVGQRPEQTQRQTWMQAQLQSQEQTRLRARFKGRRPGTVRAAFALTGALLLAGVGVTSAGFIDGANLNLGGDTIGTVNDFEVQVKVGSDWVSTVKTGDAAVPLAFNNGAGAKLNSTSARDFDTVIRLSPGSPQGKITPVLEVPSACTDSGVNLCASLVQHMRFAVEWAPAGGSFTEIAAAQTLSGFNALPDASFGPIAGGAEHVVRVKVMLDPAYKAGADPRLFKDTIAQIGVKFEAASVAP